MDITTYQFHCGLKIFPKLFTCTEERLEYPHAITVMQNIVGDAAKTTKFSTAL